MTLGACSSSDDADGSAEPSELDAPEGFTVTEVVSGLSSPTQIALAPDGGLLVAQLNGGEEDDTGQILLVDPTGDGEPRVLFDGLRKPTGLAVLGDEVWVQQERSLWRGPLAGGDLEVVLDDLPFNGRSEGTLTTLVDGRLLYETSGDLLDGQVVAGSGTLWALAPGGTPEVFATGFKNAYGRTVDVDGTVWQTEVSDGTFDGAQPPDELNAIGPGDDAGWPACIGDRLPVIEFGGTDASCAATVRPKAVFAPRATPTSVAIAPWDPDVLVVALWNEGRVVTLPRAGNGAPVEASTFLTGLARPQHLLADGDRLLVVDFDAGRILAVAPV